MRKKEFIKASKYLSLVLRHKPEKIGLVLDNEGWANVNELLRKMDIRFEDLKVVVDTNDKKRFAFSEDFTKIKANQGHSISVDLKLVPAAPPNILFHGTAERNIAPILKKGLLKRNRNHVHLSADTDTAKSVGMRYGKPVVLEVSALEMHRSGHLFYLSDNDVWLTDFVPIGFLKPYLP